MKEIGPLIFQSQKTIEKDLVATGVTKGEPPLWEKKIQIKRFSFQHYCNVKFDMVHIIYYLSYYICKIINNARFVYYDVCFNVRFVLIILVIKWVCGDFTYGLRFL
jgi:hypothetical protein